MAVRQTTILKKALVKNDVYFIFDYCSVSFCDPVYTTLVYVIIARFTCNLLITRVHVFVRHAPPV